MKKLDVLPEPTERQRQWQEAINEDREAKKYEHVQEAKSEIKEIRGEEANEATK